MAKKLSYIIIFITCFCNAQIECPKIEVPLDGDVDVPVDSQVSWNVVGGINGYSVSLGTTPGATDILNSRSAALVNYLTPIVGLPDNTRIYVTISLFTQDGRFITCPSESFMTEDVTDPPNCTNLTSMLSNAQNIKIGTDITWEYAPTATGYLLAIGTSSGGSELLEEIDVGNVLEYDPPENLPIDSEIFVRITPYNENGEAGSCNEESFTTGSSNIECDLFSPQISIPERIGFCEKDAEVTITNENPAEGFRWYKLNADGSEVLISESNAITVSEVGRFRHEAYNSVSISGENAECTNSKEFSVVFSEAAAVESVELDSDSTGLNLTVLVNGSGDYEFSLDDIEGPYQDSNRFFSVSEEDHWIFIRDKNGCGITEYFLVQTITDNDFPKFFTPNGDGVNDHWQFSPQFDTSAILDDIQIFDRYGKLLVVLDPESQGWDGTFNGRPLPSSTYWYKAITLNSRKIRGRFVLKR